MIKASALTFAVLFFAKANSQVWTQPINTSSWKTVNVPMLPCSADSACSYLTNSTYGYTNVCCATWKSQPIAGGNVTTLGNACVDQDTDFFTANFTTASGNNVWFNCSINSTWAAYVPATWSAVSQKPCTSNSACSSSSQCCNNNNATY